VTGRNTQPHRPLDNPWLKRMDQAVVAALALIALVAMGAYWWARGGASGQLIEIDRAPRHVANFQLDVNDADWPEFSVLPGIGETLARRIVDSRGQEGPFADLESLRRVRGIGPKTLERIKPYLRPLPESGTVAKE
jgi:competence protein ComEA